jgi:hypothetical protein
MFYETLFFAITKNDHFKKILKAYVGYVTGNTFNILVANPEGKSPF